MEVNNIRLLAMALCDVVAFYWLVMLQAPLLGGGGRAARTRTSAYLTAGIAVASVVVLVLLAGETRRISLIQQQLVDVAVSGTSFPTFYGGGQELAGKAASSNPNNNCGGWGSHRTAEAHALLEINISQEKDQPCSLHASIQKNDFITWQLICVS